MTSDAAPTSSETCPRFCHECGETLFGNDDGCDFADCKHRLAPSEAIPQKPAPDAVREAAELFQLIEEQCWTLRCQSYSNGDDADVGWEVIEHHMAKPHERLVASASTPLKAMREAAAARPLYAERARNALASRSPSDQAPARAAERVTTEDDGSGDPLPPDYQPPVSAVAAEPCLASQAKESEEVEQLRRVLSHARAMIDVWKGRALKAEAHSSTLREGP